MTDPWARRPHGPPPIRCAVCGTDNDAARRFCRKCATELRPVAAVPADGPPERNRLPLALAVLGGLLLLLGAAAIAYIVGFAGGARPAAPSTPPASIAPVQSPGRTAETTAVPTSEVSAPPPPKLPPTPPRTSEPPLTPTILSFDAPRRVDCGDPAFPGTISLSWQVVAAESVTISIDGTGIFDTYPATDGSAEVPFSCGEERHTYLLRTVGGSGPPDSEEVVVRRR